MLKKKADEYCLSLLGHKGQTHCAFCESLLFSWHPCQLLGFCGAPHLARPRPAPGPCGFPDEPSSTTHALASPPHEPREGSGFHTEISCPLLPRLLTSLLCSLAFHNPPLSAMPPVQQTCAESTQDAQPAQASIRKDQRSHLARALRMLAGSARVLCPPGQTLS